MDNKKDLEDDIHNLALKQNTTQHDVETIKDNIKKIEDKFNKLSSKLETDKNEIIYAIKAEFVRLTQFEPVRTLVYGMVGTILIVVLTSLMALIIIPKIKSPNILTNPNSITRNVQ